MRNMEHLKCWIGVVLIMLVLLNGLCWSHGCVDQERKALLLLKTSFDRLKWPESNTSDCCEWEMVECDATTRRVTKLSLHSCANKQLWYLNTSYFLHFEQLTSLDLSFNSLAGFVENQGWCGLQNLEELYLDHNELEGTLPPWLANLSSIRILHLSHNQFTGNIATTPIPNLKSIESLTLGYNHFQVSLKSFANHSNLKVFLANDGNELIDVATSHSWTPKFQLESLRLSNCKANNSNATFLNFLYNQFNLTSLDLSGLKFGGAFPSWLFENNTRLERIYLSNNSFVGEFQWPSHPNNPFISEIDISQNKLQGQIPSNITSLLPHLVVLSISMNSFQGTIPPSMSELKFLEILDFSNNQLFGEIKEQFANTSLSFIRLSNNRFSGPIPNLFESSHLEILLLDGNNFVGEIPDLSSVIYLNSLDISGNSLSGRLPSSIANMSNLWEIALSGNQFEGIIPLEFCKLHELKFLDLSRNYLFGSIPPCFSELANLEHVLLSTNKLRGPIPHAFHNYTGLRILDLGGNDFSGTIPNWIGNLSSLTVLLLQANNFHGDFLTELCRLKQLNILILSSNNLSGHLPGCISNLSSITPDSVSFQKLQIINFDNTFNPMNDAHLFFMPVQEPIELTTKSNSLSYTGYILDHMYEIDLSCNKFSGEIPIEFGYISTVRSLNLSHNNLTGLIPSTFSKLKQLESLDLSYNDLNGQIPPQLSDVNTLEVFSVAHNNLSGPLPDFKAQFGTFDESCYEGNPLLCGPPLNNSCNETDDSSPAAHPFIDQSEDDSFMDMIDFWVTFAVTYVVILFSIPIILFINSYWRQMWFYHIEIWMNTCYYFVVDKFQ